MEVNGGNNKKGFIIVIGLFAVLGIFLFFRDKSREDALKNTNKTWAIITQKVFCTSKGGCSIEYKFRDRGNKWVNSVYGGSMIQECHKKLKEGDTIFIRYSISDPEITELVHCYWNEKIREELQKEIKK